MVFPSGAMGGVFVAGTDLVVLVTMQPAPDKHVSGFAFCMQWDQFDRCSVGVFNFVPSVRHPPTDQPIGGLTD